MAKVIEFYVPKNFRKPLKIGDAIILHSLGVLWDHCHI
jgi:hypothetical protein